MDNPARRSNDALADALLRLHDNPSEVLHGWRLTLRESAEALRELESIGVPCTDCGKLVTSVSEVVIKGDRAMHFNCPAAERHGKLDKAIAALREPITVTDADVEAIEKYGWYVAFRAVRRGPIESWPSYEETSSIARGCAAHFRHLIAPAIEAAIKARKP